MQTVNETKTYRRKGIPTSTHTIGDTPTDLLKVRPKQTQTHKLRHTQQKQTHTQICQRTDRRTVDDTGVYTRVLKIWIGQRLGLD